MADRPARPLAYGAYGIDLDGSQLRFVQGRDGRGDGLTAITIQQSGGAPLPDRVLCGTRFRFAR